MTALRVQLWFMVLLAGGLTTLGGGIASGAVSVTLDDTARSLLREAAPTFLGQSPGRGVPLDIAYSTFRSDVWPRVSEACQAFEKQYAGRLPTADLLDIASDAKEEPRAREMAVWLLAARVLQKEDEGRPASALQLLPFGSEGAPNLATLLDPLLESDDRVTRFSATVVLGAHGAMDAAGTLARAIKGPRPPERFIACRAIGRFGVEGLGVEGFGLLRPLIYSHPEGYTTRAVMRALLLAGTLEFEQRHTTSAIDELVAALKYAPHPGEHRLRDDLQSWSPPRTEYVIGFSEEEIASGQRADAFIRACAAQSLERVDLPELQRHIFDAMLEALGDNELAVVVSAFRFMGRLGSRAADLGATEAMMKLLRSPDPFLVEQAAISVCSWGERMKDIVPILIEQTDKSIERRVDVFFLLWALGNSGDSRAEAYLNALKDRIGPRTRPLDQEGNEIDCDKIYQKLIGEALKRLTSVRELRDSPDPATQDRALTTALADYRSRRLFLGPTLMAVIRDPVRTDTLRIRCAVALREIDPVSASAWYPELLTQIESVPLALRAVLEQPPAPRKTDE